MAQDDPFKDLSEEQRYIIEDAHREGQTSEQICTLTGVDKKAVNAYVKVCVPTPRSHFERLEDIVNDLEDQCERTKQALESSDSGSAMMIQSYQRLMSEYRLALAELTAIQRPQDVVDDLIKKVFNPFLLLIAKSCVEETHNLQQELLRLNIPSRDAKGVSNEIFKRLSERMSSLLPTTKSVLDNHFGVSRKERDTRDASSRDRISNE